jgi:hypothetical protein
VVKTVLRLASVCLLIGLPAAEATAESSSGDGASAQSYLDRLIDGGNLPIDVSLDQFASWDAGGWSRSLYLEAIGSRVSRDGNDFDETGVRLGGMIETPQHGALSLDAILRGSGDGSDGSGSVVTVWQRGLAMNGDWLVNNAVGVADTPMVDLARRQSRFFVPSILMNGAAMEWRQSDRIQASASYGRPGIFTGTYIPAFDDLRGTLAGGGVQWSFDEEWSAAAQLVDVDDVRARLDVAADRISSRSYFGALGWETPDARAQLNALGSTIDGGESSVGGWFDAKVRSGRSWHSFGAFDFQSHLVWGNQQLPSDLRGGYYRATFQSRRWTADGGIDYLASVPESNDTVVFSTGYVRYQYSRSLGFGAGANSRQSGTDGWSVLGLRDDSDLHDDSADAWSVFAFADAMNRAGIGRAQVDHARLGQLDSTRLTLDQTWDTEVGRRLSTAIQAGREERESGTATLMGIAVYGGGDLGRNLSVDVNASWNRVLDDGHADTIVGTVAIAWTFADGWRASANYYANRTTGRMPLQVTSPLPGDEPFQNLQSDDSGVYLSVRYERRAGSSFAPLGGSRGTGSGSVSGILYLDGNDSNRFDAGEAGAPNVVVLLDQRFAVRTDSSGRFTFPAVAAGRHVLTVQSDNLPLGWHVPADGGVEVEVDVRDETRVELPVQRQR